jgi:hypothetical protein
MDAFVWVAPLAFVGCFELFEVGFVIFLSLIERIVGGSCIGSPAKMSFFALNIGIQQTFVTIVAYKTT